jgi:hypothetical protein
MRRKAVTAAAITGIAAFAIGAAALTPNAAKKAKASSHREAPLIANDPTADLTDLYAFMSPGKTDTVTLMANVIPIEIPAEGPNYYNLDDTARYRIMVDNTGDGKPETTFILRTHTWTTKNADLHFLYTDGPVTDINSPHLVVKQRWTLYMQRGKGKLRRVGSGWTAPNNVGAKSFPDYAHVASQAITTIHPFGRTAKVFVGPREDPFFIDVGRIFDLLAVGGKGTDNLAGVGVHSIAIQVPADMVRRSKSDPVIGVWAAVDRMKDVKVHGKHKRAWRQIERLGQPLVNEVIIPRRDKDRWNTITPANDGQFEHYYKAPFLAAALNGQVIQPLLDAVLHCGNACPLAATTGRADLSAILLRGFRFPATGSPVVDLTFHSPAKKQKPVDELRLNTSTPATPSANVDRRGLLCNFQTPTGGVGTALHTLDIPPCSPGQLDGYPNGRRLADDVTDIQVAAVLGLPINGLIPASLQRPYALLAMGEGTNPAGGPFDPLKALFFGADGVMKNDANGGKFGNQFPFVLTPNPGHM